MPFAARFSSGLPTKSLTQISGLPASAITAATAASMNEASSAAIAKYEKSKLDIGLSLIPGTSVNVDASHNSSAISPHFPTSCVEMIDSERWIKKYGLRANKLTYEHILNLIGFKQTQGRPRRHLLFKSLCAALFNFFSHLFQTT